MKSKNTAIIILVSMILVNILGCQNLTPKKTITADTPYYSVTIGSYEKSNNHYMNVDIELPKITYSNENGSALIDPLNAEIETSLTQLINEAKDKALTTYKTYIESAKTNAKNEVRNKFSKLKEKYKDVLGEEEQKFFSNFNIDNLAKMPFRNDFLSTDSNIRSPFPPKATLNNTNKLSNNSNEERKQRPNNKNDNNRPPEEFRNSENKKQENGNKNTDEKVNGFTNTEDILIPGLHNKNIIIVETTTKESTEATTQNNGKPNRMAPSEGGEGFDKQFNGEKPNKKDFKASMSNVDFRNADNKNDNRLKNEKTSTKSEITTNDDKDKKNPPKGIENDITATDSNVNLANDITIENFYRDLSIILRTRIPNDETLTREYIPTTILCNFEVKCLDEDYISLFVQLSESRTTSSIKRLFYNVDLNNGKIVNLKDILGEKFKENTVNVINSEIEKWTDEQKSTLINGYSVEKYIDENTPFFINNNHRPVVEIEKFAITIGSAGYHEFQIP